MMKSWPSSLITIAMTAALMTACSKPEPATPETAEAPAATTPPPAAAPEGAPAAPAASGKAEPGGYVPAEHEKVAPAPEGTEPHTAGPDETKTE